MSWAALQTVLRGHLTDAGAAVSPAIPVVRLAIEQAPVRQITCEYLGDGPSPWSPNTLAMRQVGEHFEIKVWLPVASFDQLAAETLDTMLYTIKEGIKSRLEADGNLGGNCERLETGDAHADWEQWKNQDGSSGQICRTLRIPLVVGMSDVSALA